MTKMQSNILQSLTQNIKDKLTRLYLKLSDCDGMCDHCDPVLRGKCDDRKQGRHLRDILK